MVQPQTVTNSAFIYKFDTLLIKDFENLNLFFFFFLEKLLH